MPNSVLLSEQIASVGIVRSQLAPYVVPTTTTTAVPPTTTTTAAPLRTAHVAGAPAPTTTVPTATAPTTGSATLIAELNSYDTRSTDRTAYWPTADDPITKLPLSVQITFACIRKTESRNHPWEINSSGHAGLYQLSAQLWAEYGGLRFATSAQLATPQQQGQIAYNVYVANVGGKPVVAPAPYGFYPAWQDGCPGT